MRHAAALCWLRKPHSQYRTERGDGHGDDGRYFLERRRTAISGGGRALARRWNLARCVPRFGAEAGLAMLVPTDVPTCFAQVDSGRQWLRGIEARTIWRAECQRPFRRTPRYGWLAGLAGVRVPHVMGSARCWGTAAIRRERAVRRRRRRGPLSLPATQRRSVGR